MMMLLMLSTEWAGTVCERDGHGDLEFSAVRISKFPRISRSHHTSHFVCKRSTAMQHVITVMLQSIVVMGIVLLCPHIQLLRHSTSYSSYWPTIFPRLPRCWLAKRMLAISAESYPKPESVLSQERRGWSLLRRCTPESSSAVGLW